MHSRFMERAIELSKQAMNEADCGPFGSVVVRSGEIVGEGFNQVIRRHDPTAHAEVMAIRDACSRLQLHDLSDCELYASCKPCPMCLGATLWARIPVVYFGASSEDAAAVGFDDSLFYETFGAEPVTRPRLVQFMQAEAATALTNWGRLALRAHY